MWYFGLLAALVICSAEYLDEWVVQVPEGPEVAERIADHHGFRILKQLTYPFEDTYVFSRLIRSSRSKRSISSVKKALEADTRVPWFERQTAKLRQKRDFRPFHRESSFIQDDGLLIRASSRPDLEEIGSSGRVKAQKSVTDDGMFNDPKWGAQWYLAASEDTFGRSGRSTGSTSKRPLSLNVVPVWEAGITGKGVVVTILDDGVERNHTDLIDNFDIGASIDLNEGDRDPTPSYTNPDETHHGTRCAGEIAMAANNNVCGVGIAFNARIGGIRMLDGIVTDRVEAEAFSFNNNYISIYSSSWGPSDNGQTVEGPGLMASRAFEKGVTEGRGGKGVIYVWASGNGGINGDSCAYDGYASSIYVLSIGSVTEHGHFPIYGELCASTMAVTYSSGSLKEGKIVSSDIMNSCTTEHTGTSASAPLAAGIIALALEANPNLTWRDMKHIVAWSADPFPLLNNPGWDVNSAGLLVNPAFGFGLMDAEKLVKVAKVWKTVPPKVKCVVRKSGIEGATFSSDRPLTIPIRTLACHDTPNEINHLEHVEVIVSLAHVKRGAVRIFLVSPAGTRALIAPRRESDFSSEGLSNWPFVSVHTWDENPLGTWQLIVESHLNQSFAVGSVQSVRLVFHGTKDEPEALPLVRQWRLQYGLAAQQETSARGNSPDDLAESDSRKSSATQPNGTADVSSKPRLQNATEAVGGSLRWLQ